MQVLRIRRHLQIRCKVFFCPRRLRNARTLRSSSNRLRRPNFFRSGARSKLLLSTARTMVVYEADATSTSSTTTSSLSSSISDARICSTFAACCSFRGANANNPQFTRRGCQDKDLRSAAVHPSRPSRARKQNLPRFVHARDDHVPKHTSIPKPLAICSLKTCS